MDSLKQSTAVLAAMAAQGKSTLVTVLGSAALLVAVSPTAKADAFLSLQNGATILSCDNSTAAGVAACLASGFTTVLGANGIALCWGRRWIRGVRSGADQQLAGQSRDGVCDGYEDGDCQCLGGRHRPDCAFRRK